MKKYNYYGLGLMGGAFLGGRSSSLVALNIDGKNVVKEGSKQRFVALRDIVFLRGFFTFINLIITFFGAMDLSLILLNDSLLSKEVEYKLKVRKDLMKFYGLMLLVALGSFVLMPVAVFLVLRFLVKASSWADGIMALVRGLSIVMFLLLLRCFRVTKNVYQYNYALNKVNNAMKGTKYLDYTSVKLNSGQAVFSASNFMLFSFLLCYMVVPFITFNIHYLLNILIKIAFSILFICLAYEVLFGIEYLYRKNKFLHALAYPFLGLSMLTAKKCTDENIKTITYAYEELILMTTTRSDFREDRESFRQVYNDIKTQLFDAGIDEAREADYLICDTLGIDVTALITKDSFSKDEVKQLNKVLKERLKRKPLCKIVHKRNFYGRDFFVDENVLSPRQETEILTNIVIKDIDSKLKNKTVLDLCTGSGAIGITIALETKCKVTASDKSAEALNIAQKNAEKLGASVQFIKSDMFKGLKNAGKFDIIVSNPPYIASKDIASLDAEVKNYDPLMALDGGSDGLDFYRIIAKNAPDFLTKGGKLYLEIGYDEAAAVSEMLKKDFENIEVIKDYDDMDRIVVATKREK